MARTSSPPLGLVAVAFLTSGFTSLVLQVVWFKSLALLLGNTLYAMSTVVAVFLAGLAIGAAVAGRWAGKLSKPLVGYGVLEMGIGIYAIFSLALLQALDPLAAASYSTLGASSPLYLLARIGLAAVILLPPTLLMGATLPWLVAWGVRSGRAFGRSLGVLYGINTLGAVLGASSAGFFLIPQLGLRVSTYLVGAIALAVGLVLSLWGQREAPVDRRPSAAGDGQPRASALVFVLVAFSGAVALVLEVAWARIFGLIFGSSVYSFALVLAAYLLGVALGSLWWGGRLADSKRPWLAFAILQSAVALGVTIGLWIIPSLPERFVSVLLNSRDNLAFVYLYQALLAGVVAFLPCLALGALFPVSARILGGGEADSGRATGAAYAINTLGTVTGSLLAGFLLLPTWGVQPTLIGAIVAAASLAWLAWWFDPSRSRRAAPRTASAKAGAKGRQERAPVRQPAPSWISTFGTALVLAGSLGAITLALGAPAWNRALLTLGLFRSAQGTQGTDVAGIRAEIRERLADEVLLYYREGLHSIVSVHTSRQFPTTIAIRLDGKPDASTGADMKTQVMAGHLPMLWTPPGSEICIIGLGSGVSMRAILSHQPKSVTMVELEPAVVEASRFFDQVNENVLEDPRVELLIEDGRQHLQHSGRTYDMIISQPPNPWVAGVNNLFTVDFYRRAKSALRPGGVFCAWVQTYELSEEAVSSLLSALHEVFPGAEVFLFEYDLLMIGRDESNRAPADRLLSGSRPSAASPYLSRFGFDLDGFVPAHHLGRASYLLERLPKVPLNRDDRPYVEYRAPLDLFRAAVSGAFDPAKTREPDAVGAIARWAEIEDSPEVIAAAIEVLAEMGRVAEAKLLLTSAESAGTLPPAMAERAASATRVAERAAPALPFVEAARKALDGGDLAAAAQGVRAALAIDSTLGAAHLLSGRLLMRQEDPGPARRHLELAVRNGTRADRAVAWMNLGILDMRQGNPEVGRTAFETALRTLPGEPEAFVNLARWYVFEGQPDSVRAILSRGLHQAFPSLPVENASAAFARGESF